MRKFEINQLFFDKNGKIHKIVDFIEEDERLFVIDQKSNIFDASYIKLLSEEEVKNVTEERRKKQAEYSRRWRAKNKEHIKKHAHDYYMENKEKVYERNKKWISENKQTFSKLCQNSRKKRVEKLRNDGCINAWSVVNNKAEPKYNKSIDV